MNQGQKILILKYRAMGDAIIGLSTVQYLRELFPNSYIIYGVPAWTAPLFKSSQTAADEILPIKLDTPREWLDLWQYLLNQNIEMIYEMFQSGRTSKFFSLFSLMTGRPYFFHNHHQTAWKNPKIKNQGEIKPIIQRDLDGLYYQVGIQRSHQIPSFLDYIPKLSARNIQQKKKKIIYGVVATRETKKLPLEIYLEVAQLIEAFDPQVEIQIPLSHSPEDCEAGRKILKLKKSNNINIVQMGLDKLPDLIGEALFYLGNDTGLKHLAIARGIKTFTFFGPEPPLEWHPYNEKQHAYFYRPDLECRTREAHYCGLKTCDSMICLNQFSAEMIWNKIRGELV